MKKHPDVERVLLDKKTIAARVAELAKQISDEYRGKNPILICILKGASVFFADLIRAMDIDLETEFLALSSYGTATETSGIVSIVKDVNTDLNGRNVLLVEDIVDSGCTVMKLREIMKARGAESAKIVCLLDKKVRRKSDISVDYTGFEIADEFVIGYGLDYAERYRNLDCVCVMKKEAVR